MFKLNEITNRKRFILYEKISWFIYILLCIAITICKFIVLFGYMWVNLNPILLVPFTLEFYILFFDEIFPVVLMSIVFWTLIYFLFKYHQFEFKKNVRNMIFFFVLEVFLMIIIWIRNFAENKPSWLQNIKIILLYFGGYPI